MSDAPRANPTRANTALLLVTLLALIVRLGYVIKVGDGITWPDESEYHEIALNLIHGNGYSSHRDFAGARLGPTAYRMPALPVVEAALYSVFGPHLLAVRILQAVLGAALVPLAFLITVQLGYPRKPAILAAIWIAVYPYYVFCAGAVYPVAISTFFLALGTYLLLRGAGATGFGAESAAGLALGASSLATGHTAAAFPFVGLWIVLNKKGRARTRWTAAALALLCWALVVAPWMVRNRIVMGKTMLSSALAYNFGVGNGPTARWDSGGALCDVEPLELKKRIAKLTEAEAVDVYMRAGVDYVRSDPLRFLTLSLGRAANFWRFYPKPASRQVRLVEKLVGIITYGPAFLLGIVWLWLQRKDWRRLFLFVAYGVTAMLIASATVSVDRYRLPYDVYLIIFASAAIVHYCQKRAEARTAAHG